MSKRARRQYTDEYKDEAVKLVRASGRSIAQVARDLDLTDSALRDWVERADAQSGPTALPSAEHLELLQLRKEVRVLRMERDLLKKFAAFFAKEQT
jgi:transposase